MKDKRTNFYNSKSEIKDKDYLDWEYQGKRPTQLGCFPVVCLMIGMIIFEYFSCIIH